MKVCIGCYNILVDDYKDEFCPLRECQASVISADENMVPTLIELNKKNYTTVASCSGHPTRNYLDCYVYFSEGIHIDTAPTGFELEKSQDENLVVHHTIRRNVWEGEWERISIEDKIRMIADINISVLKWAKSLPALEIKL